MYAYKTVRKLPKYIHSFIHISLSLSLYQIADATSKARLSLCQRRQRARASNITLSFACLPGRLVVKVVPYYCSSSLTSTAVDHHQKRFRHSDTHTTTKMLSSENSSSSESPSLEARRKQFKMRKHIILWMWVIFTFFTVASSFYTDMMTGNQESITIQSYILYTIYYSLYCTELYYI
jgi:hypothetical protein